VFINVEEFPSLVEIDYLTPILLSIDIELNTAALTKATKRIEATRIHTVNTLLSSFLMISSMFLLAFFKA